MPNTAGNQSDRAWFLGQLAQMQAQISALSSQQTLYLTGPPSGFTSGGSSIYVLDSSGNCVFILGDITHAPMGVNTGTQTLVATGLSGRGAASHRTGTWTQI